MATTVAELQAVLSADTRQFDKAMDSADNRSHRAGKSIGTGLKVAGVAAAGGLYAAFKAAQVFGAEAADAEKVTAQTAAVLKSTGGAAGVTAAQVDSLANSILKKTGIDDEAIKSGENLLLTFTNVKNEAGAGNDIFNQATQIMTDMSTALGQDMSSSAVQLGKALNDPIKGVTALSRVGVSFTAEQKESIKTMVAHGDAMGAQKLILGELTKEFGGSAEAAGQTFAGQMNIAKESIKNSGAEIVTGLMPAISKLVSGIATVVPVVMKFVGSLKDDLTPAFQAVTGWVSDHWPDIERIARQVFGAIQQFWNTTLKPVLIAIGDGIVDVAQFAQRNWPKVQAAAEAVVVWYKQNLEPTIRSVVGNLRDLWAKYGDDVLDTARRIFGILASVIKPLLEGVRSVINGILALIRGDWSTAWENFKKVPGEVLTALVAAVKGFGGLFLDAAKVVGRAILDGIVAGIQAAPGLIKDALVATVKGAFEAAKNWLFSHSPSKRAADEIGKPISEGVAQGIIDRRRAAIDAAQELVQAAVSAAANKAQAASGRLASSLGFAFQARQAGQTTAGERRLAAFQAGSGELTPAEKLLQEIQSGRAQAQLDQAVADAQKSLQEAQDLGDQDAILKAGRDLADAQANILIAGLQKQAAAEREAVNEKLARLQTEAANEREDLNQRQAFEQQNFNARLQTLQDYLNSGQASAAEARKRIQDFMGDFGIEMGSLGELVGSSWANGIRNQIPAAVQAAKDLAESTRRQAVVDAREEAEKAIEKKILARVKREDNAARGGGSGPGAAPTVPAPSGGTRLDQLLGFAHSLGFNPSSGQTTGGQHTDGSLHYQGRAVDMSGSPDQMRNAFYAAIQTFGSRIDELFYDPIGWYIDQGRKVSGAIGGHSDHVHLGIFDKGGFLKPGWNLAYNGLGRPEPVGTGNTYVSVQVPGLIGSDDALARKIADVLTVHQRRGGQLGFT